MNSIIKLIMINKKIIVYFFFKDFDNFNVVLMNFVCILVERDGEEIV